MKKWLLLNLKNIEKRSSDTRRASSEKSSKMAKSGKTIPQHTFSGPVEHAIAHIEEAVVHHMPEEQQRWYAIKIFERDDKVKETMICL